MGITLNTEGQVMNRMSQMLHGVSRFVCFCVLMVFGISVLAQDDTQPVAPDAAPEEEVDGQADIEIDTIEEAALRGLLESELASAKRFEAELAALLQPDGQIDAAQGDDALSKLASLATRCGILANSAMQDEARLVLLGYQARALAALVTLDQGDDQDTPNWVDQLTITAAQIAALAQLPGASPAADYWSLIAERAAPTTQQLSLAQQQGLAERALRAYIDAHGDDPIATEYVLDTKLSLATLLDQRGEQQEVAALLDQIGELPPGSPRLNEVNRLRDSVARVGNLIAFELISTQLARWRVSDHAGKPVLIHVYADQVDASVRMIDVVSRSIVEGSLGGIAVVSLRVGEPVPGKASAPWPTLPVPLERGGVLDQLGVTALPTLAWLDQEGKLFSVGTNSAVLDQLALINQDESDQDNEPAAEEEINTPATNAQPQPTDSLQPTLGENDDD